MNPDPGGSSDVHPGLFTNRELAFLAYNERILAEAGDPSVPLLERLKFVSIVGSNLDTFFMVRVARLKRQIAEGVVEAGPDALHPTDQLTQIRAQVAAQVQEQERILLDALLPDLKEAGLGFGPVHALPPSVRDDLETRFETEIFPVLTPLAVDPGHPFPFLRNRSLNLAIHLAPEGYPQVGPSTLLAVVQMPARLPRFLGVQRGDQWSVVSLEDLVAHHVGRLFHRMVIQECVPFRVVRNFDLSLPVEDEVQDEDDLLVRVQRELQNRWRYDVVRLEIGAGASDRLRERLAEALGIDAEDVQTHTGPLATADFNQLADRLARPDLRDPPRPPVNRRALADDGGLFETIAQGDVLLHHPYESYDPVVRLLRVASSDPRVLAIKQTLYRVNRSSPLLEYLIQAAENGKQVTALVELKARFHEETSVQWARALERAGVQVVYGLMPLKTHCKVMMIVRREDDGVRRYVHLGTGNYNEEVATRYADLSFFTADADVGDDVADLFNLLTGYSSSPAWRKLVVAPLDLRRHVVQEIRATGEHAKQGGVARIIIKSNALIDTETSLALCQAAEQGAQTDLLIRGPCTLRVGIPGTSDRLRVRMLVDRFLEHSRVLYFQRGEEERVYLTSTDIMHRNFDWRVEVMLPVEAPAIKRRIIDEILAVELKDNTKAHALTPTGAYARVDAGGAKPFRAQDHFARLARLRAASEIVAGGR